VRGSRRSNLREKSERKLVRQELEQCGIDENQFDHGEAWSWGGILFVGGGFGQGDSRQPECGQGK